MRGVDGMLEAIRYAREAGLPFFGICLGMQSAIIEFARNVVGLADSDSGEFAPRSATIWLSPSWSHSSMSPTWGGTMRLGQYPCRLGEGTRAAQMYGTSQVSERHRHRYEVSNAYRDAFIAHGLTLSGLSPDGSLSRNHRVTDPSMVHLLSVPPRAEVETDASPSTVPRFHRSRRGAQAAGARGAIRRDGNIGIGW